MDHDHKTGELRGLLCDRCNRSIGLLGDDAMTLTRAILYLASHASDPSAVLTDAVSALTSALSKTVSRETGDLDAA